MLYHGSAVATVVLDRKGRLIADPQLSLSGLAEEGDERALEDAIVEAIEEALAKLSGGQRSDDGAVEEATFRAIRRTVMDTKGKKPTTAVHVVRV
jgi:ribonuclease J